MRIETIDTTDPRDVVRGLRGAVLGAGPAIALGATADLGPDAVVAPGTAVVLTTSGSTGVPKSVVLSRSALTSSALATIDHLGAGSWLLALPAGYVAGVQVVVRSLLAGREPAILAGSFTPQTFAAAAGSMAASVGGQRTPTFTSLVPAQLQTLVAAEEAGQDTRIGSFEAILVGGQALPAQLADRAAAVGARIVRTYGSTETSGGCVYDGHPLRDVAVRVRDGEVQLSGPMLADGYLGDSESTAAAFIRDADGVRWYRTGDAGTFDDVLRITGRLDNVIVSGGINVSLDRVEQVVRAVPGLDAAIVVAVPDPRWGEASAIVVDRVDLPTGVLDEARRAVAAALGAPARPRELVFVEAMPLLSSGKPDRRAARALALVRGGSTGDGGAA
ncbi:AMP-binding protein [Microbacterium sp. TNHR37B]|uniref:AMP-binding protein n=1 Tax=Microbacterium sp. TNHR37B TaxID=1775956 RepID=UPI0007B2F66A|nr:AMP-binding protein [Microbacterium sp. TNHR37B]KZE88759.1 putative 2-succinylbenzoate--CoA ligase [Microbacterium sp. TNHR37B]